MVATIHLAVTTIFHAFTLVTGSLSYYTIWIVQVHRANYSTIMSLQCVGKKSQEILEFTVAEKA